MEGKNVSISGFDKILFKSKEKQIFAVLCEQSLSLVIDICSIGQTCLCICAAESVQTTPMNQCL